MGYDDRSYFLKRAQTERERAAASTSDAQRLAHEQLRDLYLARWAALPIRLDA